MKSATMPRRIGHSSSLESHGPSIHVLTTILILAVVTFATARLQGAQTDVPAENRAEIDETRSIDPEIDPETDDPADQAAHDEPRDQDPAAKPKQPQDPVKRQLRGNRIAVIRFHDQIDPLSEQYLYRKLRLARERHVDLVVIEIDSPGGRLDVLYHMAEHVRDIDWAPTVAYIPKQALSAAALIALACDEIVVGKNARFGDAGVIQLDPVGRVFRYAPEKIRSDLVAFARDLAAMHGRPPALAEAMIDKELEVFAFRNRRTGENRLMTEHEVESSRRPDEWEKLQRIHETRKDKFFEVVGKRAVELGIADATADSIDDLKKRYGAKEVIVFDVTAVDRTVAFLNNWLITILLFVVGLVALYVELAAPGIGIGGMVSIICFSLFFWSRMLGGTAEWLEIVLFVVGVALLAVELFVIPGFGVWGVAGLLLIVSSLILAGQDFVVPHTPAQWTALRNSALAFAVSFFAFLGIAYLITTYLGTIPVLSRFALAPPTPAMTHEGTPATPFDVPLQVGDIGIADSFLRPAGRARFGDEFYDVVSDGVLVEPGSQVRVVSVSGNIVTVRAVESA